LAGELSEWKAKGKLLTSQSSSGPYWVTSMKFSHVHGGFNIAKKVILKEDHSVCLLYTMNMGSVGIYCPCYFNYVNANNPFHLVFYHPRKVQTFVNCFKYCTCTFVHYSIFPWLFTLCCKGQWGGGKSDDSQRVHAEYNYLFKM
jgi:hypothetical protein